MSAQARLEQVDFAVSLGASVRRACALVGRGGWTVNKKRVRPLWRALGLS